MHPIERLRWVAQSDDEPLSDLAMEAAWTLAELASTEPAAALVAARRLVERHPANGPLYWACARVLESADPLLEANELSEELYADATPRHLARELRSTCAAGCILVTACPMELLEEALGRVAPTGVHLVADLPELRHSLRRLSAHTDATGFMPEEVDEALAGATLVVVEVMAAGQGAILVSALSAAVVRAASSHQVPVWAVMGVGRCLPASLLATAAPASEKVGAAVVVAPEEIGRVVTPDGADEVAAALRRATCPAGDWIRSGRGA
jgi:hypothetical protein